MTKNEMDKLRIGDSVRSRGSGEAYVIIRLYPSIVAIHSIEVTNPQEWKLVTQQQTVEENASDKIKERINEIHNGQLLGRDLFEAGRNYGLAEALEMTEKS